MRCQYCGYDNVHRDACPMIRTDEMETWRQGYSDGQNRKSPTNSGDGTYVLGYQAGSADRVKQ